MYFCDSLYYYSQQAIALFNYVLGYIVSSLIDTRFTTSVEVLEIYL